MSPNDERPAHVPRALFPGGRERPDEQAKRIASRSRPATSHGGPGVEVTQHGSRAPAGSHLERGRLERGHRHDEVAVALFDVSALAWPVRTDDIPRKIGDEAVDRGGHEAIAVGPEREHAA